MAVVATPDRAPALPARRRRLYVPRRGRIVATIAVGLAWAGLSIAIDRAWIESEVFQTCFGHLNVSCSQYPV